MNPIITTEEFVKAYKKKFDTSNLSFDKTVYVNAKTKITITCNIHGDFHKTKHNHLSSKGCTKCVSTAAGLKQTEKAFAKFLKEVKIKYNNFYSYDISSFKGMQKNLTIYCPKHGEFEKTPYNHARGSRCPTCKHYSKILAQQEAEERLKTRGNTMLHFLPFTYEGAKTRVPYKCIECGYEGKATFDNLTKNKKPQGCGECGLFFTRSEIDDKIERNLEEGLVIRPFVYKGTKTTRVDIDCNKCGRAFNVLLWTVISENKRTRTGCGCATQSRGELAISTYLQKHKIPFIAQKYFKECKYVNTLPFDFYIPSLDLLIEFHGRQHYKFIEFFHKTLEGFKERILRDDIKKAYAEKQHNFLVIPYWDFDEIANILNKTLNK